MLVLIEILHVPGSLTSEFFTRYISILFVQLTKFKDSDGMRETKS